LRFGCDSTAVFGDLGVNQGESMGLQLCKRTLFVQAHQPAVPGHISRQNSRKASLHALSNHGAPPGEGEEVYAFLTDPAKGFQYRDRRSASNWRSPSPLASNLKAFRYARVPIGIDRTDVGGMGSPSPGLAFRIDRRSDPPVVLPPTDNATETAAGAPAIRRS
jgi:hypothetical protein